MSHDLIRCLTMSDTPTFGATIVGPKFTLSYVNDDDEVVAEEFRARSSPTFDEVLEFRTLNAQLQMDAQMQIARLRRRADALEGDDAKTRDLDEIKAELETLAAQAHGEEVTRWERTLDQCTILIHPPHREQARTILEKMDPADVQAARQWLVKTVLGASKIEQAVEAAAEVDPTLPPPPPDSASNTPGGADSDETASTSTD